MTRTGREPSYLCSILDNAAARGNPETLRVLAARWAMRANRISRRQIRGDERMRLVRLWAMASEAARMRALGIEYRMQGFIHPAVGFEESSERVLAQIASMARRQYGSLADF